MAKAKIADEAGETDDILEEAREKYERAREWWNENHDCAKDDLRFARLGEQWPTEMKRKRELELKPCEVFNKMPSFIRQVVNDARQNKPAIKVHPQDSKADPQVAEILNGLIRNIEAASDADVAYDTAIEHAVGQGFGFWRINTAYTCDDAYDQDIVFERIANPFTVLGDPASTAADSSDWNDAFIATSMETEEFEREYPDAEKVDWEHDFKDLEGWKDGERIIVAEWWHREKVKGQIVALSDGSIHKIGDYKKHQEEFTEVGLTVIGQPRDIETYKVTQRIMSGAEILKTIEWAGRYIPIVPVYGDEVIDEDGKRHFRSLIRDAKGSQRMYNYMRNTGISILALQPRVPFIGPKGAFDGDPNWDIANQEEVPYLEYSGQTAPQRTAPPQGSHAVLQEALNANDDMKSIIGIYDASLGARSNETSGRAIMARQREGDVSTFHFIDNLSRAIRHCGRILLDLIPKVYSTERMIRILGEDLSPASVKIAPTGQPVQPEQDELGQIIGAVYDLTTGKYDVSVSAGPSFTSRREEVRQTFTEMSQAGGDMVASVLVPRIAKLMDIPDADEIANEINAKLNPAPPQQPQIPPELQQQMQQGMQMIQQLQAENEKLKQQVSDKQAEFALDMQKNEIDKFKAETERMKAAHDMMQPTQAPQPYNGLS